MRLPDVRILAALRSATNLGIRALANSCIDGQIIRLMQKFGQKECGVLGPHRTCIRPSGLLLCHWRRCFLWSRCSLEINQKIYSEWKLQKFTFCHSQDLARLIINGFDICCVWIGVLGFPHAVACCRRERSSGSQHLQMLDSTNVPPALTSLPSGHKTGQTNEKVSYRCRKNGPKAYLDPLFQQKLDLQPRRFWSCRHLLPGTLGLASFAFRDSR